MNATIFDHPAESPEFLSRLRDGELSAGEVASFEEHRRTCTRCRESADSYTRALSIFRSASPRPAASDLSARILRKVRAQSPSRRPFGVTFGIDVRWAGVCAAALIVVIMAASILDEGPAPSIVLPPPPSEPASVRAHLLEKESVPAKGQRQAPDAGTPARPVPPAKAAPARDALAAARPAPAEESADRDGRLQAAAPQERFAQSPPPPEQARGRLAVELETSADAPVVAERDAAGTATRREEPKTAQKPAALAAPSSRARASADAPGGEAGAGGAGAESVRVVVEAADGLGGAPELERGSDDAALAPFRGREFVLIVESGGRVRSAAVWGESGTLRDLRPDANANARAKDERESLSAFRELRFAPGERPRRLRVRIE